MRQDSAHATQVTSCFVSPRTRCHVVSAEVVGVVGAEHRRVLRSAREFPRKEEPRRGLTTMTAMTAVTAMTTAMTAATLLSAQRLRCPRKLSFAHRFFHSQTEAHEQDEESQPAATSARRRASSNGGGDSSSSWVLPLLCAALTSNL